MRQLLGGVINNKLKEQRSRRPDLLKKWQEEREDRGQGDGEHGGAGGEKYS